MISMVVAVMYMFNLAHSTSSRFGDEHKSAMSVALQQNRYRSSHNRFQHQQQQAEKEHQETGAQNKEENSGDGLLRNQQQKDRALKKRRPGTTTIRKNLSVGGAGDKEEEAEEEQEEEEEAEEEEEEEEEEQEETGEEDQGEHEERRRKQKHADEQEEFEYEQHMARKAQKHSNIFTDKKTKKNDNNNDIEAVLSEVRPMKELKHQKDRELDKVVSSKDDGDQQNSKQEDESVLESRPAEKKRTWNDVVEHHPKAGEKDPDRISLALDKPQRGGQGSQAIINPPDPGGHTKEDMDVEDPAKVKAMINALAMDLAQREETSEEEEAQADFLVDRKKRFRFQVISNDPEKMKERDALWEMYTRAAVKLQNSTDREKSDPLFVTSPDYPLKKIYRVPFEPQVPYVGVLVDAGRHYFPIDWWKHLIVYLYKLRFNVIQFRLTDDQTFNVQLESYPQLATPVVLDYNKEKRATYTAKQIRDLVQFAKRYNISMIPEINVPGHAGAWAGIKDLVINCAEFICLHGYGLPLNVEHPHLKKILKGVIEEVLDIFDNPEFLHLGGDEVNMADPCFAEVRLKPFNYSTFELTLRDILRELKYPLKRTVRWERTGQSTELERAGRIEHFWEHLPNQKMALGKLPNGEFAPWFASRGLYFDTNHEDDGSAIFRYTQGLFHIKDIPHPTAIIVGTFELGTEFWRQRNVASRLIAVSMGASKLKLSGGIGEFTKIYKETCLDMGIQEEWCNLQGNIAITYHDYHAEHYKTWGAWKDGICERMTDKTMKLVMKSKDPTRRALEKIGYDVFWENFGEEIPEMKETKESPLRDHSVAITGVIFDMVNSMGSRPSRVSELLKEYIAPLGFNFLQLRLVDDFAFAVKLESTSQLGFSALEQQFRIPDAKEYGAVVQEAMKHYDIQVIPEIALSSHAGGWLNSGFAAACPNSICEGSSGIVNDVRNPTLLPVVYTVLRELRQVFSTSPYIHLGHDNREDEGCFNEAGLTAEDFSSFEEKLAMLLEMLGISQNHVLRWSNEEGRQHSDSTGYITHHRAGSKRPKDAPKGDFFLTVDLLDGSPYSIYKQTLALMSRQRPKGILGEIRDIGEAAWAKKNVGLRLVAFAMALQRNPDKALEKGSFGKAVIQACKASKFPGCEEADGTASAWHYEVEKPRYRDKLCSEFTYHTMGRVPKDKIV
jgi:hypothetical protein